MQKPANAAPELAAIEVEEDFSRSTLLVRGALAAGALYGATAVTPLIRKAFAQRSMGDIDILNFALTLEYLEAAFYEEAAAVKGLSSEVAGYVKTFGERSRSTSTRSARRSPTSAANRSRLRASTSATPSRAPTSSSRSRSRSRTPGSAPTTAPRR